MQAWFVIEDTLEDGQLPQVCTWRLDYDQAMLDAKDLAQSHHDIIYLLVSVSEGQDPLECITPETLCVWYPTRVYDSGHHLGGQLLIEPNSTRQAHTQGPASYPSTP